jgi:ADP-ribosylglycohydrolase
VYLDASTKEFVKNVQAGHHYPSSGGNDDQADAAAHMVAVVAALAGNTSAVLAALEPVVRVTQDTDNAVAFGSAAARVLEKLIVTNLTAVEALTETVADLRDAARIAPHAQDAALADQMEAALAAAARGEDPSAFILQNGQTCDYAFTLSNVAFLAALVDDSAAGLLKGARANIMAGGDSGSRGIFFGALAGARLGDKALIPQDWVAKTTVYAEVAPLAAALVAHRSA